MTLLEVLCSICTLAMGSFPALMCFVTIVQQEDLRHAKISAMDATVMTAERTMANLAVNATVLEDGRECQISVKSGIGESNDFTQVSTTCEGATAVLWIYTP